MEHAFKERLYIGENTKEIKTLIFDFGGVLINLDKEKSVNEFSKLGIQHTEELLSHWCQKGIFLLFEEGKISTQDFLNKIRNMSSRSINDTDIKQAFFSFLVDIPRYKLDLILQLRKHYQVFLLSNINELIYDYCCNEYFHQFGKTIHDYFDKIYLSFEMKICKPDKKIYEKMLQDSGIKPEESLFLEDGLQNIKTAQSLGINTYLVNPEEDFTPLFDIPILKRK